MHPLSASKLFAPLRPSFVCRPVWLMDQRAGLQYRPAWAAATARGILTRSVGQCPIQLYSGSGERRLLTPAIFATGRHAFRTSQRMKPEAALSTNQADHGLAVQR